jgi:rSAM/selenodomain-associated transferase 2
VKLSVVLPTLNEEDFITKTLQSIAEQKLPDGVSFELLIVDGGSSDRTCEKISSFFNSNSALPMQMLRSKKGRAAQLNYGADFATGDALLFLHADTTLSPNALAELARVMQNETVQYGYFAMNFDDPHPLAALYSAATRINSILTHYGDSGIFARRTFFEAIGRFPEQEFMEDVEFLLRARAVAEPTLITNATVTTSARRFKKNGFLSQQLLNAYLIARYILGADVHELKRCYNSLER